MSRSRTASSSAVAARYLAAREPSSKEARSYRRIAMFDFDGTLFRSWEQTPSWWKGSELDKGPFSFFVNPESLDEPCVPSNPPSNYWISEAVQGAKEILNDPNTYSVLVTGRVNTHKDRIQELLAQKSLRFSKLYFNPGISAAKFKIAVLQNLLIGHNTVSEVEIWENENMSVYDSALRRTALAVERNIKVNIHHVHVPPHELVCGPSDFGLESQNTEMGASARLAARYLQSLRSPNHAIVSPARFGLTSVDVVFGEVRERPDKKVLVTGDTVRTRDGTILLVVGTDEKGHPILATDQKDLDHKEELLFKERVHHVTANVRTAAVTGDGSKVGLFIPVPPELASQFPKKKEDTSPAHITFLYVGGVPKSREAEFLDVIRESVSGFGVVRAAFTGTDCFVNPPKNKVVFSRVRFSRDLSLLRDMVWRRLTEAGFEVADSFPRYNPHTTITYMEDLAGVWEGSAPTGSWDFDEIEVWGFSKKNSITFGNRGFPIESSPEVGLQRVARLMAKRSDAIHSRMNRGE